MTAKTKPAEAQPDLITQAAQPQPAPQLPATRARRQPAARAGTGVVGEADGLLSALVSAATNKDVDADKVRALYDIHKEVTQENARVTFIRQFHLLQQALPRISATGKIEIRAKDSTGGRTGAVQQSTRYATFENIDDVIRPLLKQFGFSLSYSTDAGPDGKLLVRGHLAHNDGHVRETAFPLPAETSGSKNNVQGYGSSMAYGKRYATIALLNILSRAPEDADDDGKAAGLGPRLTKKQATEMRAALEVKEMPETRVFEYLAKTDQIEISKIEDVPAAKYDALMSLIKQA